MIALLGNLARDFLPGRPPRVGGAPFYAARALQHLSVQATIYARCALGDRDVLLPPVAALGTPVRYIPGAATSEFEISNDGDHRSMRINALGDIWLPTDLPSLEPEARWVHVAPLARSDFPAETLAAVARGRRLLLDGQGLVRVSRTGELTLDDNYDPDMLRHVWVLKLGDDEAAVVGDPASLPVREVIVTHGSRGSTVYVDGRAEHIPALSIDGPVDGDPTGAGDAFCMAYVASRSTGLPPAAAARRATGVVASILTGAS